MSLWNFVMLLIVSAITGSIGESLAGFSRGGFLVSSAIGFIGAMIGMYLANYFKWPELFALRIGQHTFPVIWSIIGSMLFVMVIGWLTRKSS
jgi:uncharacterized membrane protein YeaQ/YmgE (transglycosylase-associated protein family)